MKVFTYKRMNFLHALLNEVNVMVFPEDQRGRAYEMKQAMEPVKERYKDKRITVLLLNGGVEQQTQEGKKYTFPEIPARKNLNDQEWAEELKRHFAKTDQLKEKLRQLDDTDSGYTPMSLFNADQFAAAANLIGNVEFYDLKEFLVHGTNG